MRVRLLLLLGVCSDGSNYDVDVVARLPGGNDDARARAYRTIHATGLRTHPLHCPLDASLFTKMVADDDAVVACFADALEATIADENKNASGWSWASFAAGAGGELLIPTDFGGIRTGGVACFHQVRDAWAAAGYSATMVMPDAYYQTARTPGRQASGPLLGFRGARDVLLVPEGWHWTGIGQLRERAAARFYSLTLAAADDRGRPVAKHKAFDGKQGVAAGWAVSRDLHKRYGLLGAPELYAAPCPVEDRYYRAAAAAKSAVGAGALADVVEALTNRNATADQVVAAALARINQTRTGELVLVDTDGYRAGGQVRAALTETVARLRRRGYNVLDLRGFDRDDLPSVYAAAAAVVDFHVPGPERVVMEAALFGCWPVLVDEGYGGSALDFPIPERFRLRRADASTAEAAVVELVEGRGNATLEAEFAPWRRHVEALPERFDAAVEAFAFASHLQVHVEACGAAARPFAAIASALRAFPLASIEVHAGDAPRFLRTNYEGVEALAALGLTDAETGGSAYHAVRFRDGCAAPGLNDLASVSHGVAWITLPPGVLVAETAAPTARAALEAMFDAHCRAAALDARAALYLNETALTGRPATRARCVGGPVPGVAVAFAADLLRNLPPWAADAPPMPPVPAEPTLLEVGFYANGEARVHRFAPAKDFDTLIANGRDLLVANNLSSNAAGLAGIVARLAELQGLPSVERCVRDDLVPPFAARAFERRRREELGRWANNQGLDLGFVDAALRRWWPQPIRFREDGARLTALDWDWQGYAVCLTHGAQDDETSARLVEKWNRTMFGGRPRVLDLLTLLHFTTDRSDAVLGYTSQLVHALQVYATVSKVTDIIFDKRDAQYRRDMRLAALIHDLGKLLSLFGEADAHVDCTNRALAVDPGGGLDAIRAQFNHDEYGYLKLRGLSLPRRVELVIRFHSLFDLRNATVPDDFAMPWLQPAMNLYDMDLNPADERARAFILHFSHYDQKAKRATDYIPDVDLVEIEALLAKAFPPDGRIPF